MNGVWTYLSGWDLDADLLDGLGEFVWLDGSVVVEIEVFEGLHEDLLLGLGAASLLGQLVFQFSLETSVKTVRPIHQVKEFRMESIVYHRHFAANKYNLSHCRLRPLLGSKCALIEPGSKQTPTMTQQMMRVTQAYFLSHHILPQNLHLILSDFSAHPRRNPYLTPTQGHKREVW